jgi:hypothetical protein
MRLEGEKREKWIQSILRESKPIAIRESLSEGIDVLR